MKLDVRRTESSSMIWGVAWVANSLFVKFNSGDIYRVDEFTYSHFLEMMEAMSIGRWYNQNIKDKMGVTCVYRKTKNKVRK